MKLLKERTIGGAAVLTVSSESKLKDYIQDVFNKPTTVPVSSDGTAGSGTTNTESQDATSGKSGSTGSSD